MSVNFENLYGRNTVGYTDCVLNKPSLIVNLLARRIYPRLIVNCRKESTNSKSGASK